MRTDGGDLLTELLELLGSVEFEEQGWLNLVRIERWPPRAEYLLDVQSDADSFERQAWLLTCEDLRACRLGAGEIGFVARLSDHVLLAPYRDPQMRLGTKGAAHDPQHAVAALWERHRAVTEGWFPFERFFNPNLSLAELLGSTAAILAEGPRRVLEAYAEILPAHGVEPYVIDERAPVRWTGEAWEPERSDVDLLLLGPRDYLIGAGFAARRVARDLLPGGA